MSQAIAKWLGRWPVCIVFGVIATIMFTWAVPHGVAEITANRTIAPLILDEYYPTWTPDNARHLYAALGATGRARYQHFYLTLDFWFPVLSLCVFYAAMLSLAFPPGRRVGSETEPNKIRIARENLARVGLADWSEIRAGDALQTFSDLTAPIDLALLDGWKDLYLPMLKLLRPKLREGSVVLADNIFTFKTGLAPYVAFMRDPRNGFHTTTLPIGSGIEFSVYGPR